MDRQSFVGGTATPGVPAEAFAMSGDQRIRYDRPAPDLAEFITGYSGYCGRSREPQVDWFLPALAQINIFVDAGPLAVKIGHHEFGGTGAATLYGPLSRAPRVTTRGGILIGTGLSALGWGRLIGRKASDFHNRVVPLGLVLRGGVAEELVRQLTALEDDRAVAATLDAIYRPLLAEPGRDEPLIRAFTALTVEDGVIDIADAAERIDTDARTLRRVALRYFGTPPKLLLRRARFLRSFLRMFRAGDITNYALLDASYYDTSHFLRDAHAFLGTTPLRFMAQPTPFLDASLRARQAVLGAASQALHDPARALPAGESDARS